VEYLLVGIVILGVLIATPIVAFIAFSRTGVHGTALETLRQQIEALESRLRNAEKKLQQASGAPAPATAPARAARETTLEAPAQPVAPPSVEPPAAPAPPVPDQKPAPARAPAPAEPVVEPPPVVAAPPIIAPPPVIAPAPAISGSGAPPVRPPFQPVVVHAPNPVWEWIVGGNPVAKLGVLLLLIGVGFLLKLAADRGMLPIETRLIGAGVIALGLLALGWRMRHTRPEYALTLQGGAIGTLYLTSFAAFRVYSLLPHGLVFGLLVVICAACVALAVLQRSQSLAVLASLGGYLAPVLLSTGGGNHIALFTYYAILSLGILAISVWQAWRPLNLMGFGFTFGIGALWGADRYEPSLYASTQFFLILNVLIFGIGTVLTALRRARTETDAFIDGTLAFGTPLLAFGMQIGLTRHWEYGSAFSALAFAALYLPLAYYVLKNWPETGRRMAIVFLVLGAGFATLAIPLALSARWTSMAWALEGLGILWVGRQQRHTGMTTAGTLMLALAAGSGAMAWEGGIDTPTLFMVMATLSLTWLGGAWIWKEARDIEISPGVSLVLLAGSVCAWLLMILEGSDRLTETNEIGILLALGAICVTAVAWTLAGRSMGWKELALSAFVLWPGIAFALLVVLDTSAHPVPTWAFAGIWGASFAIGLWLLGGTRVEPDRTLWPILHTTYWWLIFAVTGLEIWWRLDRLGWGTEEWAYGGRLATFAATVLVMYLLARGRYWAIERYPRAHWIAAPAPAIVGALVLLFGSNLLDGRMPEFPYIPLINPIEQAAAFALLMGALWRRRLKAIAPDLAQLVTPVLLVFVIWWLNGLLLRTLASVGDVTWSADTLWESPFIQASMAIAWTIAALLCMALSARSRRRPVWFAGATTLGVVVVKLFLVDSARTTGMTRAIAFIGVALLVLLIGYLAPLPPRDRATEGAAS
jgi:uncharacterized membrane protein